MLQIENAEVYDIKSGTWEALPQLPYSGVVDQITVVAISDNEIMLNQVKHVMHVKRHLYR